ncbi:peptidase C15, pyroglutamyl peptidase I-like protein [Phellopilus nigrolimitatus]|nr:peptidase C15, pyroglutamyl peptidase I-like protein [Phellopilus nigrolimitatus]
MPHIPLIVPDSVHADALRVLITGFGPFASYTENPSWLAVKELHNVLLEPSGTPAPITLASQPVLALAPTHPRPIHITALEVPVTYAAVLSTVPRLHARPPALPASASSALPAGLPPPADGYDFVLHVGAGRRGGLYVERLGHKLGYELPDVDGELAPPVTSGDRKERTDGGSPGAGEDAAELYERARVRGQVVAHTLRGFGAGYEPFDEELRTGVDVDAVVASLRASGFEHVEPSANAGRYLCDFIYYCSLAEAQRDAHGKRTRVLFVHCPPVGEPLTTADVTDALRRIVVTVCAQAG